MAANTTCEILSPNYPIAKEVPAFITPLADKGSFSRKGFSGSIIRADIVVIANGTAGGCVHG